MRTVAIILGDNDFGNTFRPLLESLKAVIENDDGEMTKARIGLFVRHSALAFYIAYQYRFDNAQPGLEHTAEYFKHLRVIFDEDAEADILTNDHDSGAWYLEVQSGVVRGY